MGFRSKILFTLIVFCAGYAAGIYTLAPVDESQIDGTSRSGFTHSILKSDEFALSFNEKMHEFIGLAKVAASDVAQYVSNKNSDKTAAEPQS